MTPKEEADTGISSCPLFCVCKLAGSRMTAGGWWRLSREIHVPGADQIYQVRLAVFPDEVLDLH